MPARLLRGSALRPFGLQAGDGSRLPPAYVKDQSTAFMPSQTLALGFAAVSPLLHRTHILYHISSLRVRPCRGGGCIPGQDKSSAATRRRTATTRSSSSARCANSTRRSEPGGCTSSDTARASSSPRRRPGSCTARCRRLPHQAARQRRKPSRTDATSGARPVPLIVGARQIPWQHWGFAPAPIRGTRVPLNPAGRGWIHPR